MSDVQPYHTMVAPGLKKIQPYWYPYTTMAKQRWIGREILEVVSTEFRDRSMEYYRYALESGVTTLNGIVAKPNTIIRNGDRIENVVHRHEPPVTSTPVEVILHDVEREFIVVNKPGSIPVHASGRYYRNTLVEILENELGYEKAYSVNRLDRLTSGIMIIPLTQDRARQVSSEFMAGTVRKEYVARCKGKFPEGEVICEEPLLTVDRQMGLNIVHPDGKPAKTIFYLIRYDEHTDSSVVRCLPMTGRSHQLRVHLQYLGYPIANDPVYSDTKIWGSNLGKGGIDIVPSEDRTAPVPPPEFEEENGNPEALSLAPPLGFGERSFSTTPSTKLLPRETGHDIGMGSPVPLSSEAVSVITRLRNMKDEDEDWGRWRDVIFRAKGALVPKNMKIKSPPPQNRRKRGNAEFAGKSWKEKALEDEQASATSTATPPTPSESSFAEADPAPPAESSTPILPLSTDEALAKAAEMAPVEDPTAIIEEENLYCPECYLPLHRDPKPEKLYIFLHALKYTTSLGCFETPMPPWADERWTWDQS